MRGEAFARDSSWQNKSPSICARLTSRDSWDLAFCTTALTANCTGGGRTWGLGRQQKVLWRQLSALCESGRLCLPTTQLPAFISHTKKSLVINCVKEGWAHRCPGIYGSQRTTVVISSLLTLRRSWISANAFQKRSQSPELLRCKISDAPSILPK